MKYVYIYCLLFDFITLESCKKYQNEQVVEDVKVQSEEQISQMCYKALYQKDTIDLKINTLQNGKITGNMVMNVFNEPKMIGEISGQFRGDTLICAYTFILEPNKEITYKNPMAFLKRKNMIILGNGKLEYNMGGTYFTSVIDFDDAKYKFTNVECNDKN